MSEVNKKQARLNLEAWPFLTVILPLLVVLGFIAYLGWHSRYLADDFCTAGWLRQRGFIGSQIYWRNNWSGRYSFFFVMNLLHLLGPWVTRILPLLTLLFWGFSIRAFSRQILNLSPEENSNWMPMILALVSPVAVLGSTPKLYQSFLWQTGLLTYSLPMVLLAISAAWMLKRIARTEQKNERITGLVVTVVLAFLLGGFSETMAAFQVALLLALLLFIRLFNRSWAQRTRASRYVLAALAGALAAFIVVVTAPGNAVRQGLMEAPAPLMTVVSNSFYNAYLFSARIYRHELGWILLAFLTPLFYVLVFRHQSAQASMDSWRKKLSAVWPGLIFIPILTFLLVAAIMVPSEFALGSYPDGRVLVMAHYVLVMGVGLWGGMIGSLVSWFFSIKPSGVYRLAAGLVLFGLASYLALNFVPSQQTLLSDAQDFSAAWDSRHQQLNVTDPAAEVVAAASLNHMAGLDELERDPDHWVNRCVAMTYGVRKVVAK